MTKTLQMASGWSEEETAALIEVWGAADVQKQLDSVTRNKHIYQNISKDLERLGYYKSWQQSKTNFKNLTQKY